MNYTVQVPPPTSSRYVNRILLIEAGGGYSGGGSKREMPASVGQMTIQLPADLPHRDQVRHLLDVEHFTVTLVETNSTGSRKNVLDLVPTPEAR